MKTSRVWINLSVIALMISCTVVLTYAESIEDLLQRIGEEAQ